MGEDKWQLIGTAPKNEKEYILVWNKEWIIPDISHWNIFFEHTKIPPGFCSLGGGRYIHEPTHWMPIPIPPKE